MTVVDDPAPPQPQPGPTFRVGFGSPGRMSPFAAVRGAGRLARREVRRRPGRTALVVALVAVPVMAMTLGVVLARSATLGHEETVRRRLGGVADAWVSPDVDASYPWGGGGTSSPEPRDLPPPVVEDLVPEGSRTVTFTLLHTSIIQAGPGAPASYAALSDLPIDHPVVGDQVEVRSGRAPRGPDEVLLTTSLAERFDVAVGDTLEMDQPEGTWQVVGIGRRGQDWRSPEVIFGAFDWSRVQPGHASTNVLVDVPDGTTAAAFGPLVQQVSVVEAAPDLYETPEMPWEYRDRQGEVAPAALIWGWVAGALALVIVGIIVAAAFATSARRQLVTLGQLGAQGAPRPLVGATLALQGSWSGLLGSVAGVAGALALLAAGRPLVGEIMGRSVGSYVVRPSDVAIIVLTGTVAGTGAALVPARSAARIPVLMALAGRRPLGRVPRILVPAGLALFAVGLGLLAVATAMGENGTNEANLMAAIAVLGGLGVLFGTCCASPLAVDAAGRLGGRLRGVWRLAARSLGRQRTRSAGVVTAIAVSGAAALMVMVAVATATAGRIPGPDGVSRYSVPSHPDDVVEVSWYATGMPSTEDRPVPPDLVTHLEAIVPGGVLVPHRAAYAGLVPDRGLGPAPGPEEELWPGPVGARATVADPPVLDALGLSDRDRDRLAERGIMALWPPYDDVFSGRIVGWDQEEVELAGLGLTAALRQDPISSRGGSADILVDPDATERLGLVVVIDGGWWQAPGPLTEDQKTRLGNLRARHGGDSVFVAGPADSTPSTEDPDPFEDPQPYIDWVHQEMQVPVMAIQAGAAGVALLFTLLVMAIGLSLSATESRDERDVLVAVGAPPRTLRRMAGIKALLLAATAMALAVPAGLAPAAVVIARVTSRSLVLPAPGLALLLVGVPVAAGVAAWLASAVAQRVRPVRASTAAHE